MDTLTLSKEMNVTHEFVLNIATQVFNLSPNETGSCELDARLSDTITLMCNPVFINQFVTQHNVTKTKMFKTLNQLSDFDEWVNGVDLSGMSTKEIERIAAGGPYTGLKQVSRLMRDNGYESKVVYLGDDKQGRRWFKTGDPDIKAAKVRAKENHNVSFF